MITLLLFRLIAGFSSLESAIYKSLDFLSQEERELCPATISNHASSLLYPLKYLHRKDSPHYNSVPLIGQLRRTATILQRQGELDRPKTIEELQGLNRWLDW